jgi:large subunit ribosomal protein L23
MATTKTKKTTGKEIVEKEKKVVKTHPLILGPRITEKSALASEKGAYTFNVKEEATKNEIKKAVKMLYGVDAIKVSVTTIKEKLVFRRGKKGMRSGGKKAVVYLKKGDKISFV